MSKHDNDGDDDDDDDDDGDDDDDDDGGVGVGVALSLKAHKKFSRKIRQKFPIFDQNVPLTLAFNDRLYKSKNFGNQQVMLSHEPHKALTRTGQKYFFCTPQQPRSQGFSLKKWEGKALGTRLTPQDAGVVKDARV